MIDKYRGIEIKRSERIEEAIALSKNLKKKPKVLIRCIAYNQEEFIKDTLNGFIKQIANFSFVAIVHDDASTDSTPVIINEYAEKYPGIIIPVCDPVNRHTEKTLDYILDILVDAYQPEYVAICEGDDFWTDEKKLQKQVDYLEDHPNCVMCHGNYELVDGSPKRNPPHYDNEPYFGPGHIHNYTIASLTVLYRYDTYMKIPNHRNRHTWLMGDYPLWIELSHEGKFHYMQEVLGKYRVLPNSYSHSTNAERIKAFWNSTNEITKFYSELYGYDYHERPIKTLYFQILKQCYKNKDKEQAKKYWTEAKQMNACDIKSFLYYFCNIYDLQWLMYFLIVISR